MKNVRKIFLSLAVVVVAMVCFVFSASALDATGQCGDNVYWNFNETTGKLVISGSGEMWDNNSKHNGVTYHSQFAQEAKIKTIEVQEGVTKIGGTAFSYCENVSVVKIARTVTTIGSAAFYACQNINEVYAENLEDWLKMKFEVGSRRSCTSNPLHSGAVLYFDKKVVDSIEIPKGTKVIPDAFFSGCTSITEVKLPEGLETIGSEAFTNCINLKKINIPKSLEYIWFAAFRGCGPIDVYITDIEEWLNITHYSGWDASVAHQPLICGGNLFLNNEKVTNLIIPSTVEVIPAGIFQGCSSIESVYIPESVVEIQERAFSSCENLKSITVNAGLTNIEKHAFGWCDKLKGIYYTGSKEQWEKISISNDYNEHETLLNATIHYNYKPIPSAPIPPTTITATQTTSTITLNWSKSEGATGYRVYQYSPSKGKYVVIASIKGKTTYTKSKNLKAGSQYKFKIKPYIKLTDGTVIWGSASDAFTTATKPLAPTKVTATTTKSTITLNWSASAGATGYRVYQYSPSKGKYVVIESLKGKTSYKKSKNLKAGTTYKFKIKPYVKLADGTVIWGSASSAFAFKTKSK